MNRTMPDAPHSLAASARKACDPEAFRAMGHRLIDAAADCLADTTAGKPIPVLPWVEPETMVYEWPPHFPAAPGGDMNRVFEAVLAEATHLHHPHYAGHQVPGPLPAAALCDFVAAFTNNAMAVYEMGMSGTAMERSVLRWLADSTGLGATADGMLTSGGSLGNLTALLAARAVKAPEGDDGRLPALLVSEQAHYSVRRSVKIMGWGKDGAVAVPCDEHFRMRVDLLGEAKAHAEDLGRKVIGVVGSACTTATGSFDPLAAIAEYCEAHNLWFHVDAAHGGPACLSAKYRHLLDGIERADSIVIDPHKMMLMPALVSAVLFRNGDNSYVAFDERASYLLDRDPREEWYNIGYRTFECTKRMASLKLYACLACYGTTMFADYVTAMFDLGARFAALLREAEDFELAIEPDCNIVCFRYTPDRTCDLDALQAAIRKTLVREGSFYIVQTRLPQGLFLRVTLINPFTEERHVIALMDAIRRTAARLG